MSLLEQFIAAMEQHGYLGIMLLMFLENVFPPIPSELIMPLAGFTAARGELSLSGVIIAGTVGTLAGAFFWYYIGKYIGIDRLMPVVKRYGRWLTVSPKDVDKASRWFDKHGTKAVFFGRMVPGIRTLISVPAGLCRMKLLPFACCTLLGSFLWTAGLAVLGYHLENHYAKVEDILGVASEGIILLLLGIYTYRVITYRPHL